MSHNTNCTSSFSFVSGMVSLYYQSDHDVQEDLELQTWITDISQEGFTELPNFGLLLKSCILFYLFIYILKSRVHGFFFVF